MVSIQFDASSFPSLNGREEVHWAPVFITPIVGSPERLVAAIAVVGAQDRQVFIASGLEKLRCLYGDNSQLVIAATKAALAEFEEDLKGRGKEALASPFNSMGILSVGEVKRISSKDVGEMASNWLSSISSLHDSFALELSAPQETTTRNPRGEQLPGNVWDFAVRRKSPISQYFNSSIGERSRRGAPLSKINLDYQSPRVVANFSTIRPYVSDVRGEFNRMTRRLWELDVSQVRADHRESDAVMYELIIKKPDLAGSGKKTDRIKNALQDLKGQADEKNLILREFDNAEQIVEHLERKEAA